MITPKQRQPMTNKRRKAIYQYVVLREKTQILYYAIEETLKAEKMPAEELYSWLEKKGLKWKSGGGGYWTS